MRYRITGPRGLLLFLALALFGLICACGGDGGSSNSDASSAASDTPPGDSAAFLLASFPTLSEMRLDGSTRVITLAGPGAFIRYPAISSDGKTVAYSRQQAERVGADGVTDFGADLYVVPRGGGDPKEVAHHARPGQFLGSPMWVDGDTRLLYSARGLDANQEPDLHIGSVDLKTGATKVIVKQAAEPSISADGKELVFVSVETSYTGSVLAISNVDGSNRRVVLSETADFENILSPVFSPDGKRIAFAAMQKHAIRHGGSFRPATAHPSTHEIWVVNRDGSGLQNFADLAEINPSLSWSGNGKYLYILGTGGIYEVESTDKAARRVGEGIGNAQFVWLSQ